MELMFDRLSYGFPGQHYVSTLGLVLVSVAENIHLYFYLVA